MLTEDQLADRLRSRLRNELAAVEPRADLVDDLRRRHARRTVATRISLAAVPAVAAAAAVTMVVSGGGSVVVPAASPPAKSVVLTAAMVKRVASESRHALATSGRATISYRTTDNGVLNGTGIDRITFDGKNWNDSFSQTAPASGGQPAHTQGAINRVVNGQLYLYIAGPDNKVRWYHDTNPSGHPDVQFSDPRTLFGLLSPSAGFKVVGHDVARGVRLTELRATTPVRTRALSTLPDVDPGAQVTSLVIWVDGHQVVRQMSIRTQHVSSSDPLYLKKVKRGSGYGLEVVVPSKAFLPEAKAMAKKLSKHYHVTVGIDPKLAHKIARHDVVTSVSVAFSGFGKPQVISVPAHAVPQFGRG
ncbi:MAG TPA: hypothetical protein VFI65_34135 [Streptosporangiaceae bacterium]|nr:hypothetical protein [Streptosporangiaceae bacterium]